MATIKGRFVTPFQKPKNEIPEYQQGELRHRLDTQLFPNLGFDTKRSKDGRGVDGNLMFYELTEQGELKNPFEDDKMLESGAFLDKLAQGKILAFPAGEKNPVQLSLSGNSDIRYSVPLTELPIPKPEQPKPLNGWQRFANAITFGYAYRKEKTDIEQYPAKLDEWTRKEKSFQEKLDKRTPKVLEEEKKTFDADVARREEESKQAKLKAELEKSGQQLKNMTSEKPVYVLDQYRSLYQSYCGPKPERRESLVGKGKYFTEEQFSKLESYELPKGENLHGTEISDAEFAALSVMYSCDPSVIGDFDMSEPGERSTKNNLLSSEAHCFTPEQNAIRSTMMCTESMIDYPDHPRDNMGKVLGSVYQPSRAKVFEAVKEYREEGKPEKLAGIIASGMNFLMHKFEGKPISDPRNLTTAALVSESAALLERDPELKKAVLALEDKSTLIEECNKDVGEPVLEDQQPRKLVTPADLQTAKGFGRILDISRKNEKAQVMLHAESMGLVTLTDEQRKGFTRDRVNYETLTFTSQNDIDWKKNKDAYPKYVDAKDKLTMEWAMTQAEESAAGNKYLNADKHDKNKAELLQKFQEAHDKSIQAFQKMSRLDTLHIGPPETVRAIGAGGDKALDETVNLHLPNAAQLENLKGAELEEALRGEKLFAADSPYTQKKAEPDGPKPEMEKEKQKTAEKTAEKGVDQGVGF